MLSIQGPSNQPGSTQFPAPESLQVLPPQQQTVAILLAIGILVVVLELVRKRKLREEYSILWVVTAVLLLAMAIENNLLTFFQRAVGAVLPVSALFFGALLFLMLVALQYSVRLSKLTARNKTLCQKMALLEKDIEELRRRTNRHAEDPPEPGSDVTPEPATTESATPLKRTRKTKTEAS